MQQTVTPISQLKTRTQTQGRLRIGEMNKGDRFPSKSDTWILTSSDRVALEQHASRYGGTVGPWADGPAQGLWKLHTEATELDVLLPPNAFGDSPSYELWKGGARIRACDGVDCDTFETGPEGPEPTRVPCICNAKAKQACTIKTRLAVLFANVRLGGTWRFDSGSENFAKEGPDMVDFLRSLNPNSGMPEAKLAIEWRTSKPVDGPTQKYQVVVIRTASTPAEIVAGAGAFGGQLAAPAPVALADDAVAELGPVAEDDPDDVVADAELMAGPMWVESTVDAIRDAVESSPDSEALKAEFRSMWGAPSKLGDEELVKAAAWLSGELGA